MYYKWRFSGENFRDSKVQIHLSDDINLRDGTISNVYYLLFILR